MHCTKLNIQNVIDSMEKNMYEKLQYMPSKINGMKVKKIGNTLVVNSGLPSDTFNTAYGGNVDLKSAKDVMDNYIREMMPMAWWIGPSSAKSENLSSNMHAAGFVHDEFDVGMYCVLDEIFVDKGYKCEIPQELVVKECKNERDFAAFGEVLASIFDPVDQNVKTFYKKVAKVDEKKRIDLTLFVGYVDDEPVSTAGVFFTDIAGIYDISTCPHMQKKGYGSAMFYTALKFAKDKGAKYCSLQASPNGLNIYKRFGFKEICEFNVWSNKDKLKESSQ